MESGVVFFLDDRNFWSSIFWVFTKVVKGCKCWKGYFGGLSAKAGPTKNGR